MAVNFSSPFAINSSGCGADEAPGHRRRCCVYSIITATMGSNQLTHYAPTKAVLLGMTVSRAVALGKYSIRFNAVSLSTTETAMMQGASVEYQCGKRSNISVSRTRIQYPRTLTVLVPGHDESLADE